MQRQTGPLAIECHDRCARFHILALHFERNNPGFSIALEEQQMMNTLQSLKEFYEDQRGRYQSPTELEMRVYHRLIHIRDQRERHEEIPDSITSHPVFKLTTTFRLHVQRKSAPISKSSALVIDAEGMQIFSQLAGVLREQGNVVMIYLVACILERLFGPEMIEDIEGIRGGLSIPDIIDAVQPFEDVDEAENMLTDNEEQPTESVETSTATLVGESIAAQPSISNLKPVRSFLFEAPPTTTASPTAKSAFSNIASSQTTNVFGGAAFGAATTPRTARTASAFSSVFGAKTSVAAASVDSIKPTTDVAEGAMQPPVQASSSLEPNGTKSTLASRPLNPTAAAFIPPTSTPATLFHNIPSPPKPSFVPPKATDEQKPAATESHPVQPIVRQLSISSTRRPSFTLPKINTAISNATNVTPSTMQPPQLARIQPIALPSTPTTAPPQPNGIPSLVKANLSLSLFNNDMLSPLPLSTSGLGLVQNFSPVPSPSKLAERKAQRRTSVVINGKGKGKEVESAAPAPTHEEMRAQALSFAQKGFLVKQYFEIWKQRAIKHAAWLEACRQSDSYRRKVRAQRQARAEMAEKKRRISMGSTIVSDSSPKKRIRRRISTEYQPPRTDEELAQRLKENHEAHAHRWARGSLLQAMKSHVRDKAGTMPSSWQIWLSTNPDSDATAIWIERKFDVPDSGFWVSENIFSIPATQSHDRSNEFPGVIVFECSPIQNVKDDIERKYHILDDCGRLRDIIKTLPSRRYYIPSLLVIRWGDANEFTSNSDFSAMVQKLVDDSVIGDARVFPVTSEAKNLDVKFKEALSSLKLDTAGKLVESLTVQDLFKRFESVLDSFASEWLENSIISGEFDWTIYGEVAKATVRILNGLMASVATLLTLESSGSLPEFDSSAIDYSDAAYESAYTWLSELPGDQLTESITQELHCHRETGQDFPARTFLKYILDIVIHFTGRRTGMDFSTKYVVMRADIAASLDNLKTSIQSHQTSLSHALNKRLRRSPKRGLSEETEESISVTAKRRRLSDSVDSFALGDAETVPPSPLLNGRPSPSTSVSTISLAHGDQPRVTIAMLRALTKDMKKKYVGGSS
ncbi:hypothetical protein AX14_014477 [Amanita brunnescens Koide BX004]|nr:hypothetical protein AX14_014477 [Amanita brunnescens Koide BX004]